MLEDLFHSSPILNRADAIHPFWSFGAAQGIDRVDLLNEPNPIFSVIL
jgi:hypothetical protein